MDTPRLLARWHFTGHDRRRLLEALRCPHDARHLRRLQAVLLVAQGQPARRVAQMTGLSHQSVYNALARYMPRRDPADLADRPRSGRPPVGPQVGRQALRQAVERDPREFGYNATTWTAGLLARHLAKSADIVFSSHTVRRRLRAAGLRWKRPRHAYKRRDPHAAQKKGA